MNIQAQSRFAGLLAGLLSLVSLAAEDSGVLEEVIVSGYRVATALESLGFAVFRVIDGDKPAMERAIRSFGNALAGAEAALFFYAGHGLQVAGRNYLLPIDARLAQEQDLLFEAIDVAVPLSVMEQAGARVKLVFLDACRDNPLARSLARSIRSAGRSLPIGLYQWFRSWIFRALAALPPITSVLTQENRKKSKKSSL